jgi:hypothetical protein
MAENKNRKRGEANEYLFCTHVTSDGTVWELLLTPSEAARARRRAGRNPEDTYDNYIVLQGVRGDDTPEPQPGTIQVKDEADGPA